jgi:hypothetical protein
MVVKTPEQLEDDAIKDAIRSMVAIRVRRIQRDLQNEITAQIKERVDLARLQGKKVDVNKFVMEVARETAAAQGD